MHEPIMNEPADPLESVRALLSTDPVGAMATAWTFLRHDDPLVRAESAYLAGSAARETGDHEEAASLLESAADQAVEIGRLPLAAEANLALGRSLRALGNYSAAMERITEANRLAEMAGNIELVVDTLNMQASIINAQGQHQRALDMLNRARRKTMAAELGNVRLATIVTNIGEIHRVLGNHAEALEYLKDAYDRFTRENVKTRAASANLISLGALYKRIGKIDNAMRFYDEARELAMSAGDNQVLAAALNNLAGIELTNENLDRAETLYSEALNMAVHAGSSQYQADNLDGLGKVHLARSNMRQASEYLARAMEISREIGYRSGELDAGINLATAQLASGESEFALKTLHDAIALAEEMGDREHLISAHETLSHAYEAKAEFKLALDHARKFHEVESTVYNEKSEERTRQLTVKFELERSNHQAEMYRLKSQYLQQAHEDAEAKVLSRTRELEEAQIEIVTRLAVAAEFRDDDTGSHTRRVGRNAAAIGYAMGFPERDLELLFTAARLHDVGKIGIPDSVLLKTDRLDADEMELMRRHTVIGARILSAGGSKLLHLSETISLSHHERTDGRGYPEGLSGTDIPMAARIVAVSDVLDALTHARPYKPAWPVSEALAEIGSQSERQFDPDAVAACLAVFDGPGGLSPTDDTPDWPALLLILKRLGAERGFPAVQRTSVW